MTNLALAHHISPFDWDDGLYNVSEAANIPAVSCYQVPYPAIVAGRGSRIEKEIRMESALADDMPVFRRRGGGCSVFMDTGCVIVSAVYPQKGIGDITGQFDRCTRWLLKGLYRAGIKNIRKDGISDLVIHNHKIGGSCLRRTRNQVYFSVVLLVSCDLHQMDKYLFHPPREPSYRRGRSHHDFVANLNRYKSGLTVRHIEKRLQQSLDPMIRPD